MSSIPAAIGRPYIPGWGDLGPFAAECWIVATLVAVLLTPFFARRRNLATFGVAVVGLTLALISLLWVGTPAAPVGGGLPLRGILISDSFAVLWKAMLLIFTIGTLFLWRAAASADTPEGDGPEFFVQILGATLGMCLMASTTNLLMIFMAVELASLPSYVLAGFRKTHRLGAEASIKYVLFGAASSAVMVYGLTFLYGLYGTLDVAEIARQMHVQGVARSALLTVALFGLIVGIGFKASAVPFHFWCPDVFEGASVEVSAFLSVASKGAALALLIRLLMTVADALGYQHGQPLTALAVTVGVLGAVSATAGNTAAFAAENVKRLLAWSSIAHAGYMLCAISLLFDLGTTQTDAAGRNGPARVLLVYLAVYLFMNLGAFTVVGLVGRASGREDLHAFRGLAKRNPVLAHSMFACVVSLIGLPPFAGFVAKLSVIFALMSNGGWWWWLVAVVAVNSIVSAFYYFRIVRAMYLEPADDDAFVAHPVGVAVAATCGLALVLMLVFASPLNELARRYGRLQGVSGAGRTVAPQSASASTKSP